MDHLGEADLSFSGTCRLRTWLFMRQHASQVFGYQCQRVQPLQGQGTVLVQTTLLYRGTGCANGSIT